MRKDKKREKDQLTEKVMESVKNNSINLSSIAEINKGFKPII
jgi:hypothetical protein